MIQLVDAAVLINNEAVAITPNSLKFTEGLGEQTMRAASIGGGKTEQLYAEDIETKYATIMFDLPTTPENIELARSWKANSNNNLVSLSGRTAEKDFTRTFSQAALLSDYEIEIGTEGNISIEFKANTPV